MKVAIVLCTFFALTLAAVRPLLVDSEEYNEAVIIRPNRLELPIQKSNSDRIVNGYNAAKGTYKYQISLQIWGNDGSGNKWHHTCGGSIIKSNRILTAAHCVDTNPVGSYRVVVGEHDLSKSESSEQTFSPSSFSIHPDWDRPRLNNDVAVIRLSSSIKMGSYAATVQLATLSSEPSEGTASIVTGWGYTNYYTQAKPNILQVLDTVRDRNSLAAQDSSVFDANSQVATYDSNQGICSGDSGGPLVRKSDKLQYGVCSYVMTPCGSNKADFYARVARFNSWIMSQ